jgi:hypothetical protein
MSETPKAESRFPPPWWIDDQRGCLVVRDDNGRALGYFYFESDPNSRVDTEGLRKEEAWRLATSFAKLPELVPRPPQRLRQADNAGRMWLGILFAIFLIVALGSTLLFVGW